MTGIDLFAHVVTHETRHAEQISENDVALGSLNGQVGTIWESGWSFNSTFDNCFDLGADGQPGVAGVVDDGDIDVPDVDQILNTGSNGQRRGSRSLTHYREPS